MRFDACIDQAQHKKDTRQDYMKRLRSNFQDGYLIKIKAKIIQITERNILLKLEN